MKYFTTTLIVFAALPAWAQGITRYQTTNDMQQSGRQIIYHPPQRLETTEESRQRHNAERYEQYRNNGYQAPLGGYTDKLGDPAPSGTAKPGYIR